MRNPNIIIAEIKHLLEELSLAFNETQTVKNFSQVSRNAATQKGALGAINMLMDEKFFDAPREMAAVMDRLKEIGHYHQRPAIAMNLLNLTKRRILNRFKNTETNNWEYVVRK